MREYLLAETQHMDTLALDVLRCIDEAQEDGILESGFLLRVDMEATPTRPAKAGTYTAQTREPIRNRRQMVNFARLHLDNAAYRFSRGIETLRIRIHDEVTGREFALVL